MVEDREPALEGIVFAKVLNCILRGNQNVVNKGASDKTGLGEIGETDESGLGEINRGTMLQMQFILPLIASSFPSVVNDHQIHIESVQILRKT